MSTVLGNLLNRLFPPAPTPTAIILGLDYSGKTTFLYFLKLGHIVQTMPSIGFNVETVEIPTSSGKTFKMTAWDIGTGCGGTRNLIALTRIYLTFSEAIVWLVDSSDRKRLTESVDLLRDILPHGMENAPILM
jgi:GTPase SAR1 family protein